MIRSSFQLAILCLAAAGLVGCRTSGMQSLFSPWQQRQQEQPPVLFTSIPPKEELIAALSANSSRVKSLQTQGATVSLSGVPSIGADISLERPGRFRFKASSNFMGSLVDMGSNDEVLWLWTSMEKPASVYIARHDRLAASPMRHKLAIEPGMFVEALGLVELTPDQVIGEPVAAGKDRIQLVCRQVTSAGQFTRTLQIHNKYGYLLEQQVADAAGRPMMTARMSDQRHYHLDGVTLPHRIDLHVPSGDMQVQLNVPRYSVNQPFTTGESTFAFPREQLAQYPLIDIADPNFVPPGAQPPAQYSSPGNAPPAYVPPGQFAPPAQFAPGQPPPRTGSNAQPRYRGGVY